MIKGRNLKGDMIPHWIYRLLVKFCFIVHDLSRARCCMAERIAKLQYSSLYTSFISCLLPFSLSPFCFWKYEMCKSTSSKTGDDNVTNVTSEVTNIVNISLNFSPPVVRFRLKNVPVQVSFCKLKVLLSYIQKSLLSDVFTLWALRVISIKILLVISILLKTEWWRELRKWSSKGNWLIL